MGQRGNKKRAQSRRSIEAASRAAALLRKAENENGIETLDQEKLEMDRAYGSALSDGEFKDDSVEGHTSLVPWEGLEDPAFKQDDGDGDLISLIDKFRVIVEQDHLLEYPTLNLNVFVNGSLDEEAEFTEMFVRAGCTKARSLDEADICVFIGGADVDPQLYGAVKWATTDIHPPQDARDLEVYAYCRTYGIPMVGVCRGAQFLHVMNKGQLFQEIDGHVGDHAIHIIGTGMFLQNTPSVHHQACMPNPERGMSILATAAVAKTRRFWCKKTKDFVSVVGPKADIEAFFYRDTCCLGFQGHPEYATYSAYTVWCLEMILNHISHNHDLDYSDGGAVLRIRPELLEKRLADIDRESELEKLEAEDDVKLKAELIETEVEVN